MRRIRAAATALAMVGALAACGGDEEEPEGSDPGSATTAEADAADEGDGGDDTDAGTAGGGGTLTLGGEEITLDGTRCYLQEQEAAAGGGKILWVVQATGTDGDGEEVLVDVSRYDEDSQFAGDSVDVAVGDIMAGEATSYTAMGQQDAVTLDGETASADGLALMGDDGAQVEASFEITCG